MQKIKSEFELVRGSKNVVKLLKGYDEIPNWYDKISNIFNLLDSSYKQKSSQSLLHLVDNKEKMSKIFDVIVYSPTSSEYHLPGCYNTSTKKQIVNIGFFQIKDISVTKPTSKELYSILLYNYVLYKIHSKKVKLESDLASNIVNYYTSLFMSMFGKQYGLTGIYTSKISQLKFFVACYILASYFGLKNKEVYIKAQSLSTHHVEDKQKLDSYDFQTVAGFIKALSDYEVFSGFNTYKLLGRFYSSFGISFITAFEDIGRFLALISVSQIAGNGIVPSFIYKYNKQAFSGINNLLATIY